MRARIRVWLINLASRFANWQSLFSGPRVRVEYMREGEVQGVLSVLYSLGDEVDIAHARTPRRGYLHTLEAQLDTIETRIRTKHDQQAEVVHNHRELAAARAAHRLALIHCIEGGVHLGPDANAMEEIVERLAHLGVAYITLAHLIYRDVATDAPALPFLSDAEYAHWFPQPATGLTDIGRAAVRAMVKHGVLVDVAHMSDRSRHETFALLDKLDPEKAVPVFARLAGYRCGTQEYMMPPDAITRIKERDGVVGLIFATHQLDDGLPKRGKKESPRGRFQASTNGVRRHIDAF